jgi:DNA-binding response OmpR family regulator
MASIRLLIVEDETALASMYAAKFKMEGFEVETINDGLQTLGKMKSFKPNIVLMDVMIPGMNGIEALKKAKQDPEIKDIPIMLLTNLSGDKDKEEARKTGAVDYVTKSEFTPGEVVQRVRDILLNPAPPAPAAPTQGSV